MSFLATIRRLADATPPDRNKAVDALRAMSIAVVVFGHWLMAAVKIDDGELVAGHLLEMTTWTHPLTWILQVMPVFFVVGGFANGVSWRSARRRGEAYGGWLRSRLRRLILPVIPLLLVWGGGGWLGLRLGLDWELLQMASQVALVPTWFLAAYIVIVTIAPAGLWLWERWGWWSVVGGMAAAGLADLASIGWGWVPVGFLNYLFVWGTVHQLGFAWLDGRLGGASRRLLLAALGLAATILLVWAGPYPVAMVGLDTSQITNSYPPRVTLATLGLFQAGLVLAMEGPLRRWLDRPGPWRATVAVNSQIMTIYLWHLTAMVILLGLSLLAGGLGLGVEPLTPLWWWTRPLWYLVLAVLTVLLVLVFGRFERPRPDLRPAPPAWRPLTAVAGVCAGLGLLAAIGIADEYGLNGFILSLPVIGVLVGGVGGARLHRQAESTNVP
ncbi:MAG TPA: acyltransferase [Acidimicrobiia bacterium]|nr:acyltransferase [Acidimicrobiia bacterium]